MEAPLNPQQFDRYEKTIIFHLQHGLKQLEGKVVIDVAGMPTRVNKYLLAQGVAEVHGVNLGGLKEGQAVPAGYHHHVADARAIPAEVPQADAVLASCALEHLPDLHLCLQQAFAKLKKGGVLVMHGGPLWPCGQGHHIYVIVDGRNYFFGRAGDPLPAWGHLSHTEPELLKMLQDKGIPKTHADVIAEQVYHTRSKNRRSASSLRADFIASGHHVVGFTDYRWGTPNAATLQRIRERGHDYSLDDLSTGELVAVMVKL